MNKHLKHHIAAITAATTLLALLATAAPARNLQVSNQNFRVVWTEIEAGTEIVRITCPFTVEGTFHYRTFVKRSRAVIGRITAATIRRPCRNGEAWTANGIETHPRLGRLANTLPWQVTYEGFEGALPNITSLLLLFTGVQFKIHSFFNILGLYGDASDNITGRVARGAGGAITTLEPVAGRARVRLVNCLGETCPATGSLARAGQITLLNTTTRITVTLI